MGQKLRVAGFVETSVSDGPGVRSVLFLQGCSRGCPQCHNQALQDPRGGTEMTVEEVLGFLLEKCENRKLTITGGEPLEQREGVEYLLKLLQEKGFDLCLYTGFERRDVPSELIDYLHYLKVGDFRMELRDISIPFVGSSNQEMIDLTKERKTV